MVTGYARAYITNRAAGYCSASRTRRRWVGGGGCSHRRRFRISRFVREREKKKNRPKYSSTYTPRSEGDGFRLRNVRAVPNIVVVLTDHTRAATITVVGIGFCTCICATFWVYTTIIAFASIARVYFVLLLPFHKVSRGPSEWSGMTRADSRRVWRQYAAQFPNVSGLRITVKHRSGLFENIIPVWRQIV